MIKKLSLILLILLPILGFSKKSKNWKEDITPPWTIQIDSNLFIDRGETTNFHWQEYQFYLKRVFGESSEEYLNSKPKTSLWMEEDSCLHMCAEYYLGHPVYRDYPVVGISHRQAVDYCKWRSDRVLEFLLIENEIIDYNTEQNAQTYFTKEKYYAGNYDGYEVDHNYLYYPSFQLPTGKQWYYAYQIFEIRYDSYSKRKKKKYGSQTIMSDPNVINFNYTTCEDSSWIDPIWDVNRNWVYEVASNMLGNVSEWLEIENTYIGGNWKDKNTDQFFRTATSKEGTLTIGLRSVCSWVEYKLD